MTKGKKYLLWIGCLFAVSLFSPHVLSASQPDQMDSLISQGNRHYLNKNFSAAAESYSRVIGLGYESAGLYYNLGNAFYKTGDMARAILYYEKALLLQPGDEDTRQNLALANQRIIDKIDVIPSFFLKRWIKALKGLFSPNQWAILCLLLFAASLGCFTLFFLSNNITLKKAGFSAGVVGLIITFAGLILMYSRMHEIKKHDAAIIMAPSVNARSSPDEQSTNVFVLHEGTRVLVTDSVQQWKEIRLANGNKGWIPGEALEEI
ncbi:MAG: tetratricopeptide repeat protein [Bacteroidales bacterium]|nr:tetratricopeptide repeat protein [Bacteroidales bacterium]